jgi:hypothetical protein
LRRYPTQAELGWGTRLIFCYGFEVGEGGADAVGEAADFEVVGFFDLAFEDEAAGFGAVGVEAVALFAAMADAVGTVHEVHEALAKAGLGAVGRAHLLDVGDGAEVGVVDEVIDDLIVRVAAGFLLGVGGGAPAGAGARGGGAREFGEVVADDLEGVEDFAGAAGVELLGADEADDVLGGADDGGAVFGDLDVDDGGACGVGLDGAAGVGAGVWGAAAGGVVVIAELLGAEGGRAAAVAGDEDVAAEEAGAGGIGGGFGGGVGGFFGGCEDGWDSGGFLVHGGPPMFRYDIGTIVVKRRFFGFWPS